MLVYMPKSLSRLPLALVITVLSLLIALSRTLYLSLIKNKVTLIDRVR